MIGSSSVKVRRLIGDIEQILTTAKAKGGIIHINYSEVRPIELIESAQNKISSQLSAKPHSLSICDEVGEATVRCDRMYIENVIRNLIENSLKYSDSGVSVSIRIFKENNMMGISVEDNGWGIDKKYHKKVFREYFQAPNEGKVKAGYGIGLSYSKYIIKSHKGKMTLDSHLGNGTTITIYLPL